MFRLRTIILMWLARRGWKLATSLYRRRQARRRPIAYEQV